MARLKLPLYARILFWFLVNLLVLALLGFGFLKSQFKLGLDWMLSGEPGDRIAAIGESLTYALSRLPESQWNQRLFELSQPHGVTYALVDGSGVQWFGRELTLPPEVKARLQDKRAPANRPPRPMSKRPSDAPPKPRFMLRAGEPPGYWAGIHLDLIHAQDGRPLTLLMLSNSIHGGGLFFDLRPWIGLVAAGVLLSALIWIPFVRGLTRFIMLLNQAASRIAQGRFDERISKTRDDELGQLSVSVNTMASQLGEYVAQQRRITADVAHELCSPIARMQMALGVLDQRSTPEQAAYLKKLDNELQHMAKLVEEVLVFSRAETLPDRETPEEIDLRDLLQNVLARDAPEMGVKLETDDVKLCSLRNALDRGIGNVVRNAVRYASEIEIQARAEHGRALIRILDRGPGVPEDAISHLFEPFYRPELARGRQTGGSGLGLAITKRCIEACGGTVTAANREGGGLAVEIVLPSTGHGQSATADV